MNFCQVCDELAMFIVSCKCDKLYLCGTCYMKDQILRQLTPDCPVTNVQVIIQRRCPICKTVHRIELESKKFEQWHSGTPIQKVWPEKSADEREIMMSGCCCFDKVFGKG